MANRRGIPGWLLRALGCRAEPGEAEGGEQGAEDAAYIIYRDISERKRIEEHFGWGKTIGRIRQTVYRGLRRVDQHFKLTMTASNIVRRARILFAQPLGAVR